MAEGSLLGSLKDLCRFLNHTGIDHMLVGGLAVGIWGRPRATVDIDFLVSLRESDFASFHHLLKESGNFIFPHQNPMKFARVSLLRATMKNYPDISADFLFADAEFGYQALMRKLTVMVEDTSVNIASPEDVILLKLLSGREQDLLDVKMIQTVQAGHLDTAYLNHWAERLSLDWKTGSI